MIIRGRPSLLQVIFTVRGSVLERIWPQICLMVVVAFAVVFAHKQFPEWVPVFNGAPFSLLGVSLSIFLGFRNSACYDRWWEARKHWGQLVASARDLSRQTLLWEEMGGEAAAERRTMLHLTAAHAYALADHLRPNAATDAMIERVPEDLRAGLAASDNKPYFLIMAMGRVIARLRARQVLTDMEYDVFNETLTLMNGVSAACERLRNTPVPFGYTLLLLRTAYVFCLLVPFGFAEVLGWTTPVAAAVFAYALFGLDALGDELEEPFGDLPNDLPIRAMAVAIDITLRQSLGETDLPDRLQPVGNVLL